LQPSFYTEEQYCKHLVGNGWSIPVVEHMLAQLRDLFADDMLSPYPKYTYTHPWEPYKSLSTNVLLELQTILNKHRISLKVHDEIVGLLKDHSSTSDSLPFSTDLLLSRNHFLTKLEKIMDVSKLKHEDVQVKLSSGGVASVAV